MLRTGSASKSAAPNFPRGTRRCLFALQRTNLQQAFDRPVTDPTYARSFAQADSHRIR
jgi:hypothetical protein